MNEDYNRQRNAELKEAVGRFAAAAKAAAVASKRWADAMRRQQS